MKNFVFLLLLMVISVCCGEDDAKDVKSPLDYFTNPKLAAAVEAAKKLKDLIHSSSSSHVQKREKTSGFEFLDMTSYTRRARGIPRKDILKRIIKRYLKPFAAKSEKPEIRQIVKEFEEFLDWGVESDAHQLFSIISQKADGKVHAIFIHFNQREDGKFDYKHVLFNGRFRLAADMVIVRSTKSNFFSSSSKDVIRYLPRRGLTGQDIRDLMELIVPKIASVVNDFVPADN